jgi:hypothetical protein
MGKQYPNFTEIILPDIIAKAWATLSKVYVYRVRKGRSKG